MKTKYTRDFAPISLWDLVGITVKCPLFAVAILLGQVVYAVPNAGNFALPPSQQAGPLLSFGQNVINKGQLQFYFEPQYLRYSSKRNYLLADPSILYGLSDNASLMLSFPYALKYRNNLHHSQGFSDIALQAEYAYYNKKTDNYKIEATVVGAISLPTGSQNKTPTTGNQSAGYFVGTTYNMTYVNWLWYFSPGINFSAPIHRQMFGSQFLYEFGVGKILASATKKYILLALLEFDGRYAQKNKRFNIHEKNTGGNSILATPSIWLSTPKWIFQLGVTIPAFRRLNGDQRIASIGGTGTLAYTFN